MTALTFTVYHAKELIPTTDLGGGQWHSSGVHLLLTPAAMLIPNGENHSVCTALTSRGTMVDDLSTTKPLAQPDLHDHIRTVAENCRNEGLPNLIVYTRDEKRAFGVRGHICRHLLQVDSKDTMWRCAK